MTAPLPPGKEQPPAVRPTSPVGDHLLPAQSALLGIALMVAAVACFAGLDATAKWLGQRFDPLQVAALRYASGLVVVAVAVNPLRRPAVLRSRRPALQIARGACMVAATLSAMFALRSMALTTYTSIVFAAPLLVALMAGPLLGEWIGRRRGAAVAVGFLGVLIVTRPWGTGLHPAMLFACVTALANALYSMATRALAGHDRTETTLLASMLVGTVLLVPVLPLVWVPMEGAQAWLVMGLMVLLGTLGHWLLILAHARARASVVAPFTYAQLPCAALVGFAAFGERPDLWMLLGGTIIMGSGLYLLHRERAVRAALPRPPP